MRREHINISSLTPLLYIESTGTQWIDTGFKLNNNSRVVIDWMVTQYQTYFPSPLVPFGARQAYSNNTFTIFFPVNRQTGVFRCYGNLWATTLEISNIRNSQAHLDANKRTWSLKINGQTYDYTFSTQTFQNQGNCYLFKCNFWTEAPNTNGVDVNDDGHLRIYSCDIYDNGTQVRQFRPYLNAGEPGMFDELNNMWYGNNGTGEFLYA